VCPSKGHEDDYLVSFIKGEAARAGPVQLVEEKA